MKSSLLPHFSLSATLAFTACVMVGCSSIPPAPVAVAQPVQDTYFGTTVTDPFRYFENVKDDPKVQAWFKGQADHTRGVLDSIPGRKALLDRMMELSNAVTTRITDVTEVPGRIFYNQRKSGENQFKLYTRAGWDAPEKLLLDPDTMKGPDGEPAAINYYTPSPNGRYVAVGVSLGGSENATVHVLEVATGKDLGIAIPNEQFGAVAWRDDEGGFYYNQLKDRPKDAARDLLYQDSQVHFHKMGTDVAKDPVVFGTEALGGAEMTPAQIPFLSVDFGDPRVYAVIEDGVRNEVAVYQSTLAQLDAGQPAWKKVVGFDDGVTDFETHGNDLYMVCDKNAPRFKLLHMKADALDIAHADVVIPPGTAVVESSSPAHDALYIKLLDGGIERLQRVAYTADAKPQEVDLPVKGTVDDTVINSRLDGLKMHLTSWINAGGYYAYDSTTGKITDTLLQPHGPYEQPDDLVAEDVRVPSYDGTMIPLSIIHKKGIKLHGTNPCWVDAYGAYGIVDNAYFSPSYLAWYELGGIYAVAAVRGGGAFGEEWHQAGKQKTKPNTWKDLIACAQWLEDKKYTSAAHLGIMGGSAGGITVGRAMTERPDLFAAVVGQVGLFDTVRSEVDPNGIPNIPEFGSFKNADDIPALVEMDAYLHVKDGVKYPAALITTGMNDPRVPPWEPGKFVARLQQAGALALLRVDYEAGHGYGSTKAQALAELADSLSFFLWQFGEPGYQPQ